MYCGSVWQPALRLKSEGEIKSLNTNSVSSVEGFLSENICTKVGENSWILKDYFTNVELTLQIFNTGNVLQL